MNCNTGGIQRIIHDIAQAEAEEQGLAPIEEKDLTKLTKMNKNRRKGWMRNKPCPCGSEKKFKVCCWLKYID